MSTAYYIGLGFGALRTEKFIVSIGHIKAFSVFAFCLSVATILHGVVLLPEYWFFLRIVSGVCLAGLYVVIESWLTADSCPKVRGRMLALYMITLYSAQSLGQLLMALDQTSPIFLFSLAAMLSILSIIPLSITRAKSPKIVVSSTRSFHNLFTSAPSAVIGCLCSGLILGSLYGLYPLFIIQKISEHSQDVGYYMAALIFGGMCLQYPVGKLSDTVDRRIVLCQLCCVLALTCWILCQNGFSKNMGLFLSFLLGGFTCTIYPTCIAHACDLVEKKNITSVIQGLLLIYSIGAALGPLASSLFMYYYEENGLMIFVGTVSTIIGIFLFYRMIKTNLIEQEENFFPSPRATATVATIDPRGAKLITVQKKPPRSTPLLKKHATLTSSRNSHKLKNNIL